METGIFGATNGGDDLVEGETERQALRQNLAHEWNPRFGQQGRRGFIIGRGNRFYAIPKQQREIGVVVVFAVCDEFCRNRQPVVQCQSLQPGGEVEAHDGGGIARGQFGQLLQELRRA